MNPGYPDDPKTVGEHIRKRRMDLGLRQSDVAARIGVWTSTVNYWENGHFNPDVQFVPRIVAFLGYDPFGPPPDGFPGQIKGARFAAGLSRRQLAAAIRVHPGTVAEWERGEANPLKTLRVRLRTVLTSVGR